MGEPRAEKVAIVAEVREKLTSAEAVVLTEYRGLSVRDLAELRNRLRPSGGEYKVYKNTMVRFAATELELPIGEHLTGPTAIAFASVGPDGTPGDPVALAKALTEFAKDNDKLVLKAGMLGDKLLSVDDVIALSKIAPREELLARLAGGMAAPMQQFAALLKAVPAKFAYALSALIEAGGAPGAPESAPAADAATETAPGDDASTDDVDDASAGAPEATAETDEAAEAAGGEDNTEEE